MKGPILLFDRMRALVYTVDVVGPVPQPDYPSRFQASGISSSRQKRLTRRLAEDQLTTGVPRMRALVIKAMSYDRCGLGPSREGHRAAGLEPRHCQQYQPR